MLRRSSFARLRVLCLTMLPDGGALTPALKQLGYTPYSLRSSFQQGHASTHPIEWSKLLDGTTQTFPPKLLADYDCVVGPPGAMLYTTLLHQAPQYTKVVLVEEADKDRWAENYEAYMSRLQKATKRASKNKIAKAFQNMLAKMVVGGDAFSSAAVAAVAAQKTEQKTPAPSHSHMTASSGDLRRSFAAEAAAMKGGAKSTGTHAATLKAAALSSKEKNLADNVEAEESDSGGDGDDNAGLQHPRAIALQLFEESVKISVPPSQLLVYRYGDGWEPLCSFLDKPIPSVPFPPYDDGLHVLGNLQERIEYAFTLQYVLGGVCVVCFLLTVLPRCTGVPQFFKDLYTDYQVAFGAENDEAAAAAGGRQTEAEKFEEEWRKRGGSVTRTTSA